MSSNLSCVGLPVSSQAEFEALAGRVLPASVELGRSGNLRVLRWEDPSGARLIFRIERDRIRGFVPSFAGVPGATISPPRPLNDDTWSVDILDADGEVATVVAIDLEQGGLAERPSDPPRASIVALGRDVRVHADEAAFQASDDSLLAPGTEPGDPPPHVVERGWPWPPRMGAESIVSFGQFSDAAAARADARLHGVVLRADRRTTVLTGAAFLVARVRTFGMEVDLCLEGSAHPADPTPGQVVGGTVYLVGSLVSDTAGTSSLLDRLKARIA